MAIKGVQQIQECPVVDNKQRTAKMTSLSRLPPITKCGNEKTVSLGLYPQETCSEDCSV